MTLSVSLRIAAAGYAVALVIGCQTFHNTPAQDYVWEMGRACDTATWRMTSVEADGRYTVQGASNAVDSSPYIACMDKQMKDHPYQEWVKTHQK